MGPGLFHINFGLTPLEGPNPVISIVRKGFSEDLENIALSERDRRIMIILVLFFILPRNTYTLTYKLYMEEVKWQDLMVEIIFLLNILFVKKKTR